MAAKIKITPNLFNNIDKYPTIELTFKDLPEDMSNVDFTHLINSKINNHPKLKDKLLTVELKSNASDDNLNVCECPDGSREWHQNNKFHRLYGPAIEHNDGTNEWYQHGNLHRVDGPAIDRSSTDGTNEWFKKGLRHRLDGPAIEFKNGTNEWYVYGIELTEAQFNLCPFLK
jgi:hypothetical protein